MSSFLRSRTRSAMADCLHNQVRLVFDSSSLLYLTINFRTRNALLYLTINFWTRNA